MSATQTSYIIEKIFDSSREMKLSTELYAGMICETLGFHEKYDGGGAKYIIEERFTTDTDGNTVSTEANDMDIIAIGGENYTLIARFLYEGKPINVLQFGAINTYTTTKPGYVPYNANNEVEDSRDDQPAIQRVIDYTHDKLCSYKEFPYGDDTLHCYSNAINTIIIPEGNYVIKTQIQLPPYMRFYLTGDVQFLSVVKPFSTNDITTFKLEETDASTYKFESINNLVDVPEKTEIFAKNDFYSGETKLKLSSSNDAEYYVYKHGTIKICYKFDENGNHINPYKTKANDRYAVVPTINNEIFCGPGALTLNNLVNINGLRPYYLCAIEIGNTEENLRYHFNENNSKGSGIILNYENLRLSNLKIRGFHIGILQHAHSFYSNVISDVEFFDNDIGFQ